MDPRERADAALARARARGSFVVTPDDAVSPMDAASTLQIPRAVVHAAEQLESTIVLPGGIARGHLPPRQQPPVRQPQPQPVQPHQPPQHQPPQGYPPRGHQTGPHQPVPYPGPPPQQHQPVRPEPQQYDEQPRQLDGLVPTTQQPGTQRSMMSRRLDGH